MTVGIRVRLRARRDLEEAAGWYEAQISGLGGEFLDEVQSVFASVGEHPEAFPVVHRETTRVALRRFPFGVYYRVSGQHAVVIAVLHGSRHPRRWMDRT